MNSIVKEDFDYISQNTNELDFKDATILITGCAGFLGYYITSYFSLESERLGIKNIIALDSFLLGYPEWLEKLKSISNSKLKVQNFTLGKNKINTICGFEDVTHVIHMASIASPTFYRKFPLETIEANVWGLKDLLDSYKENHKIKGFLFFSSSEIYGDPDVKNIPTNEDYRGFVSSVGPRACYDESKRFGETLCSIYRSQYDLPITIVRPFNNYGPGMKLNDRRLPADLARCIIDNKPIIIFSNGKPTRTFCYIADAICGYLKALCSGLNLEFNIGIDTEETSVSDLATCFKTLGIDLVDYSHGIEYKVSDDKDYLNDNPQRRCPNILRAREKLGYNPKISINDGVRKYLTYLLEKN